MGAPGALYRVALGRKFEGFYSRDDLRGLAAGPILTNCSRMLFLCLQASSSGSFACEEKDLTAGSEREASQPLINRAGSTGRCNTLGFSAFFLKVVFSATWETI